MSAEVEVRSVIFLGGQGTVVIGHTRLGVVEAGQVSVLLELGAAPPRRLEVSLVQKLTSMEGKAQAVGIVFRDPPALNDLKRLLPPGTVLELEDPPASGAASAAQ